MKIYFFLFLFRQERTIENLNPCTLAVPRVNPLKFNRRWKWMVVFVARYSKKKCIIKLDVVYYPIIIWLLVYLAKHKCVGMICAEAFPAVQNWTLHFSEVLQNFQSQHDEDGKLQRARAAIPVQEPRPWWSWYDREAKLRSLSYFWFFYYNYSTSLVGCIFYQIICS